MQYGIIKQTKQEFINGRWQTVEAVAVSNKLAE